MEKVITHVTKGLSETGDGYEGRTAEVARHAELIAVSNIGILFFFSFLA